MLINHSTGQIVSKGGCVFQIKSYLSILTFFGLVTRFLIIMANYLHFCMWF